MYRLLNQLEEYSQNNELGIEIHQILKKYKEEELNRNSVVYENSGSFHGIILSRRGIVIQ